MIKVKNSRLDNETIETLNEIVEQDIKALAAFKLTKIINELNAIVKNRIDSEIKLVQKYAVKDESGNVVQPKDENGNSMANQFEVEEGKVEEFNKEMNDLLNYENELSHDPISISELGLESISVKKMMKIDFLFSE